MFETLFEHINLCFLNLTQPYVCLDFGNPTMIMENTLYSL